MATLGKWTFTAMSSCLCRLRMATYRYIKNHTEWERLPVEKQNDLCEQAHKLANRDLDLVFWGFLLPLPFFLALTVLVHALFEDPMAKAMLSVLLIGPIISFIYAWRLRENYHLLVLLQTTIHNGESSNA